MKTMCSGLTFSAATTRSPSFSRSSSSTMMTNLPALRSSIAWEIVAAGISASSPIEQTFSVAGQEVHLEVDHPPGRVGPGDGHGEGVRDQRHLESGGVDVLHGEAGPIDRDRPLLGHVRGQAGREL